MANPTLELDVVLDARDAEIGIRRLQNSLVNLGRQAVALNRTFNQIRTSGLSSSLSSLSNTANNTSGSLQRLGTSGAAPVRNLNRLGVVSTRARSALTRLRNTATSVGNGLRFLGTQARTASLAIGALAAGSVVAFDRASGLLGSVQSLGLTSGRVRQLSREMNTLATSFGITPDILQAGTYELISAWGDARDIIEQLTVNARIATAGQTDLSTAIDFTSKTLKAFGLEGAVATAFLGDLAFSAIQVGQFNFNDLASTLPRVATDAQILGVQIEEVIASFAELSGLYPSLNELATGYSGVIRSMVSPSEQMEIALDKLRAALINQGRVVDDVTKSSGQLVVETLGLYGALDQIVEVAQNNPTILADFFPDTSALGFVQRYAESADGFYSTLQQLEDSAGGLDTAIQNLTTGLGESSFLFNRLRASVQVVAEELGLALAPAFRGLFNLVNPGIQRIIRALEAWNDEQRTLVETADVAIGFIRSGLGSIYSEYILTSAGIFALSVAFVPLVAAGRLLRRVITVLAFAFTVLSPLVKGIFTPFWNLGVGILRLSNYLFIVTLAAGRFTGVMVGLARVLAGISGVLARLLGPALAFLSILGNLISFRWGSLSQNMSILIGSFRDLRFWFTEIPAGIGNIVRGFFSFIGSALRLIFSIRGLTIVFRILGFVLRRILIIPGLLLAAFEINFLGIREIIDLVRYTFEGFGARVGRVFQSLFDLFLSVLTLDGNRFAIAWDSLWIHVFGLVLPLWRRLATIWSMLWEIISGAAIRGFLSLIHI